MRDKEERRFQASGQDGGSLCFFCYNRKECGGSRFGAGVKSSVVVLHLRYH